MNGEVPKNENKSKNNIENNLNKKKIRARKIFIKNPKISYLNISSNFIFSEDDFLNQLMQFKNKNLIKLSAKEEYFLKMNIEEISIENSFNSGEEFLELNIDMYNSINNLKKKIKYNNDDLVNYVKKKY